MLSTLVSTLFMLTGLIQGAAQPNLAPLVHEAVLDAPVTQAWKDFTTKQGLESWMVSKADVDLRVGGLMRTKYGPQGELGDEGTIENTILSFDPERMYSIKVSKYPKGFPFPKAVGSMWTVVYFEPIDASHTKVIVKGFGWTADEESQKMRAFFDQGNKWTVEKFKEKYAKKS